MKAALLVVLAGVTMAFAQDAPPAKTPELPASQAPSLPAEPAAQGANGPRNRVESTMAIKPLPEMQKLLNALTGFWDATEKIEPSATQPQGEAGQGAAFFRPGPGAY